MVPPQFTVALQHTALMSTTIIIIIRCFNTITGVSVAAYWECSVRCAAHGMYSKCRTLLSCSDRQLSERPRNLTSSRTFLLVSVIAYMINIIANKEKFQVFFMNYQDVRFLLPIKPKNCLLFCERTLDNLLLRSNENKID